MKQDASVESPRYYIGIGASAGGLEALQILLKHLPADTGACFVIVQHLSPDFESMMLELLSKHTSMQIRNVQDGVQVRANTIYLIPPKKNMVFAQGHLLLSDKDPESGLNLPIDIFFRSLAADQQHKAIGIVLSGTGSDGSRGMKTLKEAGALVIAQQPESAKFDGMPNSAINTGVIDLILRPEDMGAKLESYIQHPLMSGQADSLKAGVNLHHDIMGEIFNVLKTKSEIDFAKYKPLTVARRIERRMTINQVSSVQEYLTLLFKEPYEVQVLSRELLIGVTRFFRDDDAFTMLRERIVPEIVRSSTETNPIRVWVAACSTGEEAYSLAILFAQELAAQNLQRVVKIFATDVNGDAIGEASSGIYREDIQHDVGAHFLSTYFTKTTGSFYQVNKDVREMVIFASHNMIVDPPFSNMDLVSCRNILIYFQHSVQKRVLSSLHFALKKDGFLFLGSSENLAELTPHFETINERNRLYKKRSSVRIPIGSAPPMNNVTVTPGQSIPSVSRLLKTYRGTNAAGTAVSFANEVLITKYAPPCILLNDEHEAIHVYGDVSRFVKRLPPGRISIDVKDMVNDDMSIAVTSAIHRAKQTHQEVYYSDIVTGPEDDRVEVSVRVNYIKEHEIETSPGYYWLVFETDGVKIEPHTVDSVTFDAAEQSRQRIEELETELKRSREHLQVTVEELETTNEELQSANEELMSANEELQSTNEELQSVNEELYTVNSEYQEKIAEVSQTNNDLDEVLSLSRIGIVFVDENMLIRRYTQAASQYINLLESDINRPLYHISKNIDYEDFLTDVATVFNTGQPLLKEVAIADKRVLQVSIHSYAYSDVAQTKGVAITFSDVTNARYTEQGMVVAYDQLRLSINNILESLDREPLPASLNILVVDDDQASQAVLTDSLSNIDDFAARAIAVATVAEAIAVMAREKIDVCLADYHLMGESAVDLAQAMAADKHRLPLVVVTGQYGHDLRPMLLAHGVLDLLDKAELSSGELAKSIRFAIRRRQIDGSIAEALANAATA